MNKADLEQLYAYNRWANARTLGVAEKLTDEQLHRDLKSSFPSVHATLIHMLGADWLWLERWNGSSPSAWPDHAAFRTVADVRTKWLEVEQGQVAAIAALDDLARPLVYRNVKGEPITLPTGLTMQHVVNHATYHRGQITTMLRQLGAATIDSDFFTFVRG